MSNIYFLLVPLLITGFGVFCCFWGYGLFRFTLVLLGFFAGIYAITYYGASVITDRNVLIIIAIATGIILGLLIIMFYYAGIFLAGCLAALVVFNYLSLRFDLPGNIFIIIGICLIGGIISLFFQRFMIVVSTAIIGSFAIIHGIGYLIYQLRFGSTSFMHYFNVLKTSSDLYYLLLFIVAIIAVCGIIFQLRMLPEQDHH